MSKKLYYLCDRCHKAMDGPCKLWMFADGYSYEGEALTRETRVKLDLCHLCLLSLIDQGTRRYSGGEYLVSSLQLPDVVAV